MKSIKNMLASDERITGIAELHWIYIAQGLLWFFSFSAIGYFFENFIISVERANGFLIGYSYVYEWLFFCSGLLMFLVYAFKYVSTYIWVTDRRIIYKTGLIFIKIKETDLQEIKEERVNQGWFGALFDYGSVYMDCRFVQDLQLPAIKNPLKFMKIVFESRENIARDVVIE